MAFSPNLVVLRCLDTITIADLLLYTIITVHDYYCTRLLLYTIITVHDSFWLDVYAIMLLNLDNGIIIGGMLLYFEVAANLLANTYLYTALYCLQVFGPEHQPLYSMESFQYFTTPLSTV